MKCIATQEQIRLLCKSENVKEYKNLLEVLLNFKEKECPIYDYDIEHLKLEDNEIYGTLYYGFKELLKESSSEWVQTGFKDFTQKICDLCGNTRLKYNFGIKNMKNQEEMIIGSKCIDKFPDINKAGINIKSEISKAKKIDRIIKFNNRYEKASEMLENWKMFYFDIPMLLNRDLDNRFAKLIKNSNKFYEEFINGNIAIKKLEEFQSYIYEFEKLENEVNEFCENYKDNKYICDKRVINWIKMKNKNNLKNKIINNNGLISKETAKVIYCIDFINRFYDDIKKVFNDNGFEVEVFNEDFGVLISYKLLNKYCLRFMLSLKEFAQKFSMIYFENGEILNKSYIFSNFRIYTESNNLEEFVIVLKDINSNKSYNIKNEKIDETVTNYIIVENANNEYTKIDVKYLYSSLNSIFSKNNSEANKITMNYLESLSNWKDKSKYNEKEIRRSMAY
mgnify:CR=1 FL=1